MRYQVQLNAGRPQFVAPSQPHELKTLILKLRWMGIQDEAKRLTKLLMKISPAECSLIGPLDRD